MTNHLNYANKSDLLSKNVETKKSPINIHNFLLIVSVTLMFALAIVLGVSYFFGTVGFIGKSYPHYFCPKNAATQLEICLNS